MRWVCHGECNESQRLETVLSKKMRDAYVVLVFVIRSLQKQKPKAQHLVSLHNPFFLLSFLFYHFPSSIFYSAKSLFNFLFGYDTPSLYALLAHSLTHTSFIFLIHTYTYQICNQSQFVIFIHSRIHDHARFSPIPPFYARFPLPPPRAVCLPSSCAVAVENARITTKEATLDNPSIDRALTRAFAGSNAAANANKKTIRIYIIR